MRSAAASLPAPDSATTSTGTSFCDSSRITASTVRIPELTLSSHARPDPFRANLLSIEISERWIFMLGCSERGLESQQQPSLIQSTRVAIQHDLIRPQGKQYSLMF